MCDQPERLRTAERPPTLEIVAAARQAAHKETSLASVTTDSNDNYRDNGSSIRSDSNTNVKRMFMDQDDHATNEDNEDIYRLPSPREQTAAMAKEFGPGNFIPIDVTGSNFVRQSSFRRSLLYEHTPVKRRRPVQAGPCRHSRHGRRNTLSEDRSGK